MDSSPAPRGEASIVLGGGAIDSEVLAITSYWRSIYAWQAWKEGTFRKVVEDSSVSTRENALAAKALLAGEPGAVVLGSVQGPDKRDRQTGLLPGSRLDLSGGSGGCVLALELPNSRLY